MLPIVLAGVLAAPAPTGSGPGAEEPFLSRYAATRGFRAGAPTSPALTPDGRFALFLRSGPRSATQSLFETDLASGATRELASARALPGGAASPLTAAEQAQLERQRIAARGITAFRLSKDGAKVLVTVGGKPFVLDRLSGAATALAAGGRPLDARFSPDGRAVAYVAGHDLRVLDLSSGKERAITSGGTEDVHFGTAEFVAQEELERFEGFWWSPDSRLVAYQETDEREVERFTIHDPLHPEKPADAFRYPRAGRANAKVRVGVAPAAGGATVWIDWDRERWPYLGRAVWPENGPLSLVVLDREQQELVLLAADPRTGATRVLVRETDPAWVNLVRGFPKWRKDGKGFFWHTERNGGPEIEERSADGALVRSWVKPAAGFADLVGFDDPRRALWFTGGPDPSQTRLYRSVDGGAPSEWRPPKGPVTVAAMLSEDGSTLLVSTTTLSAFGTWAGFREDGAALAPLPSLAEAIPFPMRSEIRRVGKGDGLYALVFRPRTAPRGARLPVVDSVYGGPHAQMVHAAPDPIAQWLADQGFLVVSIDGRGTPRRGRAFERAIRGDLGGLALDDQVAGLEALAREIPEMDLGRVAAFGWSFGGTMAALSVLRRPDVFRTAVAGAPVTDWLDYDTAYTERYLGLPQEDPEAYRRSSLPPLAARLTRPLLLVHGTADDNVYFFHSLKLADALLRAGASGWELLALPGLSHMALRAGEPDVVARIWERMIGHLRAGLGAAGSDAMPAGARSR
jgi:dipeptidyl-peptidase-4